MSETFSRQQVDAITAPWLNLCKEQEEQITKLQAENDKMRKAILTWWRGSTEDTVSEKELYRIATGLEKVSD